MKIRHIIALCILSVLITSVVVMAEERALLTDAKIRELIVGTWTTDLKSPTGKSMNGSVSIEKNGTCSAKAVIIKGEQKTELNYECVWEVKDGVLIEKVTKTNNQSLVPLAKVTRDSVIRLDATQFVYKTEKNRIQVRQRKNDNG